MHLNFARRQFVQRALALSAAGLTLSRGYAANETWPVWRRDMRPGTWKAISVNTLADINPERDPKLNPNFPREAPWHGVMGQVAVVSHWSGGAWDEDQHFLWVYGGGHTDSAENSIYGIELNTDAPRWKLILPPSGALGNTGRLDDRKENTGMYFDGRPRSSHTYGLLNVVDHDLWMWPQGAQFITGGGTALAWRFSREKQTWTQMAATPLDYSEHYSGTCWLAAQRELWHFPNTNSPAWVLNVDTRQARRVDYDGNSSACKASIYDAQRQLIVVFGNFPQGFILVRPQGPRALAFVPPLKGSPPPAYASEGRGSDGWAYDALNDVYCSRRGKTADVNILVPPHGKEGLWAWRVMNAAPENTLVPPPPAATGTYGRWFASASLGVVGCVNHVEQKLYVLALPTPSA